MAGEWRENEWGEIATLEYGKSLRDYRTEAGRYRVYGTNGPIGWHEEPLCMNPGVIVGRKGAYRGIHYSPDPFFVIDTAFYLKPKVNTDIRWAYYCLLTYDINGMDSGSAIPSTSRESFYRLPVLVPPFKEQQAIACILGALDDKIELNRRMNRALEATARAIFKSWFVDFDPVHSKAAVQREHPEWPDEKVCRAGCPNLKPEIAALFPAAFEDSKLGEIPRGWQARKFGDCCNVKGGYAYKSKDFVTSGYPLVRIKNITAEKTVDLFGVVYLPESRALETRNFWLSDGDLVMAMTGATIGKYGLIVNRNDVPTGLLNQRVAKITPKHISTSEPWFLFAALLVTDVFNQIVNIGGGSAQPNISSNQIENCRFLVPIPDLIVRYVNTVEPSMQKWLSNTRESRNLAALRDALLPKLIRGELRVPDAERITGRCV